MDQALRRAANAPLWNGWGRSGDAAPAIDWRVLSPFLADATNLVSLLATPSRPLEEWEIPPSRLSARAVEAFAAAIGADRISLDAETRRARAAGRSYVDLIRLREADPPEPPDAVVFPRSRGDVAAILRIARDLGLRAAAFGAGATLEPHAAPEGLIRIDLTGLGGVARIDDAAGTALIHAGARGPEIEQTLGARGWTLGHYPAEFDHSTLGGWLATAAPNEDLGDFGDWLVSATLATPEGLWTAEDAAASPAGLDLRGLPVGARGALGVITDAVVKLRPAPAARMDLGFRFARLDAASEALRLLERKEPHIRGLRILDAAAAALGDVFAASGRAHDAAQTPLPWRADGAPEGDCLLIASIEAERGDIERRARAIGQMMRKQEGHPARSAWVRNWRLERRAAYYRRDALFERGLGWDRLSFCCPWDAVAGACETLSRAIAGCLEAAAFPDSRPISFFAIAPHGAGARVTAEYIFPRRIQAPLGQAFAYRRCAARACKAAGVVQPDGGGGAAEADILLEPAMIDAVKAVVDPEGVLRDIRRRAEDAKDGARHLRLIESDDAALAG